MNQGQLAQELGVSGALVTKWKKKGMPTADIGEARNWLSVNVRAMHRPAGNGKDIPPREATSLEDRDTWEARLKRSRDTERQTSDLLQAAIAGGGAAQIPGLLKCHSQAVEAVAIAEKLAADARLHSGELIHRETVRAIMRDILSPLREALDKLPIGERTNCNPDHPEIAERSLTEWRNRLLARGNVAEAKF